MKQEPLQPFSFKRAPERLVYLGINITPTTPINTYICSDEANFSALIKCILLHA